MAVLTFVCLHLHLAVGSFLLSQSTIWFNVDPPHAHKQACFLSRDCFDAAIIRPCSISEMSSCINTAMYSADLISHMVPRQPEAVQAALDQDLVLVYALLRSTPMMVCAQLANQTGETQLPELHLSFARTSMRETAKLIVRHFSASRPPSSAGPHESGPQESGGTAVAAGNDLLGDGWIMVLKEACRSAWEALALRHSTKARVGDLEEIHSISASLICLGLGEGIQAGKECGPKVEEAWKAEEAGTPPAARDLYV